MLGHSDSRAVASSSSTVPGLSVPGDINSLGVHRSSSVSSSGGKSPRSVSSDKEDSLSSNGDSRRNSLQRNRSMSTSSSVAGDTASLSSLNIEGRSGASAAAHAQSHQSLGPAVSGFSVVKTLKDRGRFPCSGFQRPDEILDLRKLLEGSYLVEPVMHFSNVYLDSNDRLRRVCTLTPEGYILTSPEEPLSSCSSPTALQQAKENVIRSLNSEKNSEVFLEFPSVSCTFSLSVGALYSLCWSTLPMGCVACEDSLFQLSCVCMTGNIVVYVFFEHMLV